MQLLLFTRTTEWLSATSLIEPEEGWRIEISWMLIGGWRWLERKLFFLFVFQSVALSESGLGFRPWLDASGRTLWKAGGDAPADLKASRVWVPSQFSIVLDRSNDFLLSKTQSLPLRRHKTNASAWVPLLFGYQNVSTKKEHLRHFPVEWFPNATDIQFFQAVACGVTCLYCGVNPLKPSLRTLLSAEKYCTVSYHWLILISARNLCFLQQSIRLQGCFCGRRSRRTFSKTIRDILWISCT